MRQDVGLSGCPFGLIQQCLEPFGPLLGIFGFFVRIALVLCLGILLRLLLLSVFFLHLAFLLLVLFVACLTIAFLLLLRIFGLGLGKMYSVTRLRAQPA